MELPRYEDRRPYVTVDDLSEFAGPEHGVVELRAADAGVIRWTPTR